MARWPAIAAVLAATVVAAPSRSDGQVSIPQITIPRIVDDEETPVDEFFVLVDAPLAYEGDVDLKRGIPSSVRAAWLGGRFRTRIGAELLLPKESGGDAGFGALLGTGYALRPIRGISLFGIDLDGDLSYSQAERVSGASAWQIDVPIGVSLTIHAPPPGLSVGAFIGPRVYLRFTEGPDRTHRNVGGGISAGVLVTSLRGYGAQATAEWRHLRSPHRPADQASTWKVGVGLHWRLLRIREQS